MFDFRRITLFCLGYRLSNNKCSKNLVGLWPRSPPPWLRLCLWHYRSFSNTSVSGSRSETILHCFVWHSVSVLTVDLACFIVENVRTLTHVFVSKRQAHF